MDVQTPVLASNRYILVDPLLSPKNHLRTKYAGSSLFALTHKKRDVALFNRFAVHTLRDYGRDDIVTFRSPENPNRVLIKRILAVEGDTVKTLPPYPEKEVEIPKGHIWVEGDEHFVSDDSNRFGPISEGLIESKLVMLVWPLSRFGRLKKPSDSLVPYGVDRITLDELKREQNRHSRVIVHKSGQ